MKSEVRVVLHNVRSSHNVGAILRTADGAGVRTVYGVGYTPAPINRFGVSNTDIAKTALGAEKSISWLSRKSLIAVVNLLVKDGFAVIAVEQGETAIPLKKFKQPKRVAYVFGNEVSGLTRKELALCNGIVEIPMLGGKESLNVSSAAAIVLYRSLV